MPNPEIRRVVEMMEENAKEFKLPHIGWSHRDQGIAHVIVVFCDQNLFDGRGCGGHASTLRGNASILQACETRRASPAPFTE